MPKTSSLVGLSLSVAAFRQRYDSTLLGVKRGKGRPDGQFKDLEIKAGDIFLLDAGKGTDTQGVEFNTVFSDIHDVKAGTQEGAKGAGC